MAIGVMALSKKPVESPVEFTVVLEGRHSLIDTAAVMLIDNAEDWTNIWHLAQGQIEPMPPVAEIDFQHDMILAAFMGQKNSGGYRIEIAEITLIDKILTVKINNYSADGGMMLTVLTSPYQIVSIPKGDYRLKVEYSERKEQ
jgi:hypothetical protein